MRSTGSAATERRKNRVSIRSNQAKARQVTRRRLVARRVPSPDCSYAHPMTGTVTAVQGEPRMLIDGDLVDAATGNTFENVNPADEQVLGVCADGSAEDMQRAIAAAGRAFDETTWPTDHSFRRR